MVSRSSKKPSCIELKLPPFGLVAIFVRVAGIVPVACGEVPDVVAAITPVLVAEMVPALVAAIIPDLAEVVTEIARINVAAKIMYLAFFIFLLLVIRISA